MANLAMGVARGGGGRMMIQGSRPNANNVEWDIALKEGHRSLL